MKVIYTAKKCFVLKVDRKIVSNNVIVILIRYNYDNAGQNIVENHTNGIDYTWVDTNIFVFRLIYFEINYF